MNADIISISSNTCLKSESFQIQINKIDFNTEMRIQNEKLNKRIYRRLVVHKINNLRPFGGCFFNNTSNACNVKFE